MIQKVLCERNVFYISESYFLVKYIVSVVFLVGCASGCVSPFYPIKVGDKLYNVDVEILISRGLKDKPTFEVFSKYINKKYVSFPIDKLESRLTKQLEMIGYHRPVSGQIGQIYVLVDRKEVSKTVQYEVTERELNVCGESIIDYLADGYRTEKPLPLGFEAKAFRYYKFVPPADTHFNGDSEERRRTVPQQELDKVCVSMSRNVTRQKEVSDDHLVIEAVPSSGYFSGTPQAPLWRVQVKGGGGIPSLLVAAFRAVERGDSGHWQERVKTSDPDYL